MTLDVLEMVGAMRLGSVAGKVLAAVCLCSAIAAAADAAPITTFYSVSVSNRYNFEDGVETTISAPITFVMSMTFDDALVGHNISLYDGYDSRVSNTVFGTPTFAGVPELLGGAASLRTEPHTPHSGDAARTQIEYTPGNQPGTMSWQAGAFDTLRSSEGSIDRVNSMQLWANGFGSFVAADTLIDAPTFLDYVDSLTLTFYQLTWAFDYSTGRYLPNAFQYSGIATRIEVPLAPIPARVPEPGTLGLIAVAGCLLTGRNLRRRYRT